jgi:hypothetical protein
MKPTDKPGDTPLRRFDYEVAAVIDQADKSLTISEMVGCLELHLHILKCRFYPAGAPLQSADSPPPS